MEYDLELLHTMKDFRGSYFMNIHLQNVYVNTLIVNV